MGLRWDCGEICRGGAEDCGGEGPWPCPASGGRYRAGAARRRHQAGGRAFRPNLGQRRGWQWPGSGRSLEGSTLRTAPIFAFFCWKILGGLTVEVEWSRWLPTCGTTQARKGGAAQHHSPCTMRGQPPGNGNPFSQACGSAGQGATALASPGVAAAGGLGSSRQHVSGRPVPSTAGIGCARASQSPGWGPITQEDAETAVTDSALSGCGRRSTSRCQTRGQHPSGFKRVSEGPLGRKSAFEISVLGETHGPWRTRTDSLTIAVRLRFSHTGLNALCAPAA